MYKRLFFWLLLLVGFAVLSPEAKGGQVLRLIYDNWGPDLDPANPFSLFNYSHSPSSLRQKAGFPGNATRRLPMVEFLGTPGSHELPPYVHPGDGEYYADFTRGFIEAPETGVYRFWIRADDEAEFFLSTDHQTKNLSTTPVCAERIPGFVFRPFVDLEPLVSIPISLVKGQKYYFELFHIEQLTYDMVAIGWTLPNGSRERPIPAKYLWPFPVDPVSLLARVVPPTFTVPPRSIALREGETTTLTFTCEASQPATVQWRKNGQPIPGATAGWYDLPPVSLADQAAQYDAVVMNTAGTTPSPIAVVTVIPDTIPPSLSQVLTFGNLNGVDVIFSERVGDTSLTVGNYAIDQGITILEATRVSGDTVRLKTSAITENKVYTLTVNGVQDRAATPNTIIPSSTRQFLQVHGSITRKVFQGIPSQVLSALQSDTRFTGDTPDILDFMSQLETPPNVALNYGVRFQGYVVPLVTGDYTFYICSDNEGALFLSTDDKPENTVPLAREPIQGNYRDYIVNNSFSPLSRINGGTPVNRSVAKTLQRGQKYYIEAMFQAGGFADYTDNLSVTWERQGERPVVNGDPPIQGLHLSAFGYKLGPVQLLPLSAVTVADEFALIRLAVSADGAPPFFYQWSENGAPLTGATNATLLLESDRLLDGKEYRVEVRNRFSAATSTITKLKINFDDQPPQVLSARSAARGDQVVLNFSERLSRQEAETSENYQIQGLTVKYATLKGLSEQTVILTTTPQQPGTEYTILLSNLADTYPNRPNIIPPGTSARFKVGSFVAGSLIAEHFNDIEGTQINDLERGLNYPGSPDSTVTLREMALPPNQGKNFGVRITGFVVPPSTGEYQFYIRSAETSQFSIGTDETSETLRIIAGEPECCQLFTDQFPRRSDPVPLIAGKRYSIEVLMKTAEDQDFLEVAWRKPGETTPTAGLRPIESSYLGAYIPPVDGGGQAPVLSISRGAGNVQISWPAVVSGYVLQEADALTPGSVWRDLPPAPGNQVVRPTSGARMFYRLRK